MKSDAPLQHSAYLSAILNLCATLNRTANSAPPFGAKSPAKKSSARVRRHARLAAIAS